MSADRITISGLRLMGTHGVLPEEQARPQSFRVDLEIELDLRAAAASDDLDDTIDYGAVADEVARIVGTEHHALLEKLADRIASAALAHPQASAVTVSVTKLQPPLPLDLAGVSVTIRRP